MNNEGIPKKSNKRELIFFFGGDDLLLINKYFIILIDIFGFIPVIGTDKYNCRRCIVFSHLEPKTIIYLKNCIIQVFPSKQVYYLLVDFWRNYDEI